MPLTRITQPAWNGYSPNKSTINFGDPVLNPSAVFIDKQSNIASDGLIIRNPQQGVGGFAIRVFSLVPTGNGYDSRFVVDDSGGVTANYITINNGAANTTTPLTIINQLPTTVGAIVRGAASQTSNLQEWQNSASVVRARVDSGGAIYALGGFYANFFANLSNPTTSSYVQYSGNTTRILTQSDVLSFVVFGITGQTANLQEWQINGTGTVSSINNLGAFLAPAATTATPSIRLPHGTAPSAPTNGDMWTTTSGLFVRVNGATVGPLGTGGGGMTNPMTTLGDIIYGGASGTPTRLAGQSTNGVYLLRANVTASTQVAPDWIGSTGSGNVVLATSPTFVTQLSTPRINFTGGSTTISALTLADGTVSFEGSVGQLFSISNSLTGVIFSVNDISGLPSLEITDVGLVRFNELYGQAVFGASTAAANAQVSSIARVIGNIPIVARGASGQTANLQEWQNNTPTTVASIANSGNFTTVGTVSINTTGTGTLNLGDGTITKTSGSGFQLNSSISLNNSPIISSTTATTASIFVSTVTGITIGSSTIRTTQFPADGTTTTGTASGGYMGMPQVSTGTTRTLLATDAGKHIYVTATGQSIQIPAEGTTNFPVGTTIVIINAPSVSTSITITTDTLRLANSASTGTRTLASNGMCTLVKIATGPGVWIASGNGLT